LTDADTYGRDEVGPVNWILHREWVLAREVNPLRVRRAETTRIAIADLEAPSNHLRLALGVAAGALLVAGSFVANSFSGTSEGANSAGPVPEHTFASLEQRLIVTEPRADAPAPAPAPAPVNEEPQQETAPASAEPQVDAGAAQDHVAGGGDNQRTAPSAPAPAPAPAPVQNQPVQNQQWGSGGQWGSGAQWGYGSQWGSGSQWDDSQWGYGTQQWSPVSGFGAPTASSYSAATSTPTGPAMSTLDPFCSMTGR
jgi:hypothetical protein